MSGPFLDAARRYTAAHLSVVPVRATDKLPLSSLLPRTIEGRRTWAPFQDHIPGAEWLDRWFARSDASISLVCGRVSGGLEVIDFDHHPPNHPQLLDAWAGLVESQAPGLVARLVIAGSQHDGRHVFYRCPEIAGSQKLAQYELLYPPAGGPVGGPDGKPGRGTSIETRGEGGYALVAPTPGYRVLQGTLEAIPTIAPEEREFLLAAARAFNSAAETVSPPPTAGGAPPAEGGLRPGDDYNRRATPAEIAELLARHGWWQVHRQGEVTYWRRPGKAAGGWSATLNHIPGKLYVFSSNAGPFANERAYDPFAVYALLEHGGDWHTAARGLAQAGYGAQAPPARRKGDGASRAGAGTPYPPASGEGADASDPPGSAATVIPAEIVVTNRPLPAITAEALSALRSANDPPELFVRSGALARVRADERGRPVIDAVDAGILRARMARTGNWYRRTPEGALRHVVPPDDVVKDILALGAWPFPPLEALTETPALRPAGTILDRPGYDPATGLHYLPPPGFAAPAIPDRPDRAAVRAATALVDEAIGEFPYADAASKANTWALLLTPVLRPAIRGNTPLALIDKPQAGTGASLLAELVAILATGRPAAMMTAPNNEEEWRKKITAALSEGSTVVTIDNLEGPLASASLAAALTSSTWKDRILGQTRMIHLAQRATWLVTGNNIRLGGDMPRRCYWIRLNAHTAQPWRRSDFRHPGLVDWATENRGQLLGALLTLARAWWADGCPPAAVPALGGFEDWAQTVGGVLAHAGILGFLGNLDDLYRRVDEEGAQWQAFFSAWHDAIGPAEITVAELIKRMRAASQPALASLACLPQAGQADPGPAQKASLPWTPAQGQAQSSACPGLESEAQPKGQARGQGPGGEGGQDGGDEALLEALPDYLADGLADERRAGSLARRMGHALAKRADMVFDETGLRLTKVVQGDRKAVARWRVETPRG